MKVKALKPHCNGYGDSFEKKKGAEYTIPDEQAGPLIAAKLIAEVKPAPGDAKGG